MLRSTRLQPIQDFASPSGGSDYYITADSTQTEADKIVNSGIDIVDRITGAPNRVKDLMDDWNQKMIDFANRFRDGASEKAEQNLRSGKISALWSRFGEWLSKPRNLALTGGAAILLILLLRK